MKLKQGIVFIDCQLKSKVYKVEGYAISKFIKNNGYKLIYFNQLEKAEQFQKQVQQLSQLNQVDTLYKNMLDDITFISVKGEKSGSIRVIDVRKQKNNIQQEKTKNVENTKILNSQHDYGQQNNIEYKVKQQDCNGILDEIEQKTKETQIIRQRLIHLEKLDQQYENLLFHYPKNIESVPILTESLYSLYFDGASKSNPGPAGAGVALFDNLNQIKEISQPLGKQTNNSAEFFALFIGVRYALNLGINHLVCFGDSKLIIDGMNNKITFQQPHLGYFQQAISKYTQLFKKVRFIHILRNQNKIADNLASKAAQKQKNIDQ
ncbi:unnamed protein product [Paramecium sonneborni]|uniref:RNase H type-1 domain-containing protein n=1 Tax=Paramecium sonneborni TaxID=65129 RepID=A0A8S1KZ87_9CILI|nr:unnamed protein product [Paramecium sonneborni]